MYEKEKEAINIICHLIKRDKKSRSKADEDRYNQLLIKARDEGKKQLEDAMYNDQIDKRYRQGS